MKVGLILTVAGGEMKTNFDVCCESVETMAEIIDIMKCGWTKEQVKRWLETPFAEGQEGRRLRICYLSDIPVRLRNSMRVLANMESGNVTYMMNKTGFITKDAEYRFIDCKKPEEYVGVRADQAIIDYRSPMREIAEILTADSCVPDGYRIIDDREIGTSDSPM